MMLSGSTLLSDVQTISRIRTALLDASRNSELIGGASKTALQGLKDSVEEAMKSALSKLVVLNQKTQTVPGFKLQPKADVDAVEALGLLRRVNNLYAEGMKRFDNIVVEDILKQAKKDRNSIILYTI